MNRRLFYISFLILILLIGGCEKQRNKVLYIGTHADYPPFEYLDEETFRGIDIEIGKKIADKMGMEYKIRDTEFDKLLTLVQNGEVDLAISAITITSERSRVIDFSQPYYVTNQEVLTRYDNPAVIRNPQDLAEFRIGAQNGTTGMLYIKEHLIDKQLMNPENLITYSTNNEAVAAILVRNLDYLILDASAAEAFTKLNSVKKAYTVETHESYGIAMPKESNLNHKIKAALQDLIDKGEVLKIIQDYTY